MLQVYQLLGAAGHSPAGNRPRLQFIHLTGKAEYAYCCNQMAAQGINEDIVGRIVIRPYLERMEYGLSAADLVIGRAGAATIAELTALGIPAILVPYPYAAGNHQYQNARYLAREGAAVLIPEPDLTPELLLSRLEQLSADEARRREMGQAARRLGKPRAAEIIARTLLRAIADVRRRSGAPSTLQAGARRRPVQ
jgi:UDP-N-acetylglucosamine--N-acetylmuramyl-(pentapeptide) pyrophosphoryl-undecaprenol N-acetylglucosamine transferase